MVQALSLMMINVFIRLNVVVLGKLHTLVGGHINPKKRVYHEACAISHQKAAVNAFITG